MVDYLKPSCGACRRLFPKLQQIAAQNPDALFVKVRLGLLQLRGASCLLLPASLGGMLCKPHSCPAPAQEYCPPALGTCHVLTLPLAAAPPPCAPQVNVDLSPEMRELGQGMGGATALAAHSLAVRAPGCVARRLPAQLQLARQLGGRSPQPPARTLALNPSQPAKPSWSPTHSIPPPSYTPAVTHLPWFHIWRGGELVTSFSASVTTVATLRAEIAAHKACEHPACSDH